MRQARDVPLTEDTCEELGRLLRQSSMVDAFAWLDLVSGELIITTSMYGMGEDGAEPEEEANTNITRLPAQPRPILHDWMEHERAQMVAICADETGRYLRVPVGANFGEPGVLDAFARTLTDTALRNAVYDAMRGRGAFNCVKDLLHDKGKIELWYAFEQDRDRAAVREWLASEGIRAADDDCEDD